MIFKQQEKKTLLMKCDGTKGLGYCIKTEWLGTAVLEVKSNSELLNADHAFKEYKENLCYQMDISTVVEEQKNSLCVNGELQIANVSERGECDL